MAGNHFGPLLHKNFLTLWRNKCFCLFFILLPIISMGLFTLVIDIGGDDLNEVHEEEQPIFLAVGFFVRLEGTSGGTTGS